MKKLITLSIFLFALNVSSFGQVRFGAGLDTNFDIFGASAKVNYQMNEQWGQIASVDIESIQHISKADALNEMFAQDEWMRSDSENPFLDIIVFQLKRGAFNDELIQQVENQMLELPNASNFFYESGFYDGLQRFFSRLKIGLLIVAGIFMILVGVLLHNIIRMQLLTKRKQIEIMELVGATRSFIRRPFLKSAFMNGAWSGGGALVLLVICVLLCNQSILIDSPFDWYWVLPVLVLVLLLGIFVSYVSTYIIVNLYLSNLYKS